MLVLEKPDLKKFHFESEKTRRCYASALNLFKLKIEEKFKNGLFIDDIKKWEEK